MGSQGLTTARRPRNGELTSSRSTGAGCIRASRKGRLAPEHAELGGRRDLIMPFGGCLKVEAAFAGTVETSASVKHPAARSPKALRVGLRRIWHVAGLADFAFHAALE